MSTVNLIPINAMFTQLGRSLSAKGGLHEMTDEAFGNILTVIAIFATVAVTIMGGLCGVIIMLLRRNADGTSQRSEKQGDKQAAQGETLAALRADINQLKAGADKCDDLDRDVAVLKDFKARAEAKFDEVDETSRELRGMSEQMKTAFNQMKELPEQITARVKAEIPKVVLDTLSAARALNDPRKVA